jgi:hypothetical protein
MAQVNAINRKRLKVVVAAALLYFLGGCALTLYCFSRPAGSGASAEAAKSDEPPPAPPPPAPPPSPQAPVSPEQQRKIDDAIVNGAWYLRNAQHADGSFGNDLPVGYTSLVGLTLLECGVPTNHPSMQQAAAFVRQRVPTLADGRENYQRSLAILFLDRLGESRDEELIRYLALCLMAGQHPTDGAWTYSSPNLDRALLPQLIGQLHQPEKVLSLDKWRNTALKGAGFNVGGWDNSNTQFVVLALWVAQRHGVPIGRTIAKVEQHFRSTQLVDGPNRGANVSLDGSWYYDGGQNVSSWPTMTCSGLLGLAIAHGVDADKKEKPLDDPAVKRALAMLGREIDRPNEPQRPLDLYFLWSLERVAVLYEVSKIDGKDWYGWGSTLLLKPGHQAAGGSWPISNTSPTPMSSTCFALLFLKRANLAKDLSEKLQLLAEKK